jgi:hypothetical protein
MSKKRLEKSETTRRQKFKNSEKFAKAVTVDSRYNTPLWTGQSVSYIGGKFEGLSYNWG